MRKIAKRQALLEDINVLHEAKMLDKQIKKQKEKLKV
jgi:hypothetical protein